MTSRRRDHDGRARTITTRRPRRLRGSSALPLTLAWAALLLSNNGVAVLGQGQEGETPIVDQDGDFSFPGQDLADLAENVGSGLGEAINGVAEDVSGAATNLVVDQATNSMTPEQIQEMAGAFGQDITTEQAEAAKEALENNDVSPEQIQEALANGGNPADLIKEAEAAAAEANLTAGGQITDEMIQTTVVEQGDQEEGQGEGEGEGEGMMQQGPENMVQDQDGDQEGFSEQVGGETAFGGNFVDSIKGGINVWCEGMRNPDPKPDCYDELAWLRYDLRMDFLSVYYCSIPPTDLDLTYTLCPGTYDTVESQRGGDMWGYGTLVLALPGATLECGGGQDDECTLTSCFFDRDSDLMGPQVQVMAASDAAVHYGALSVAETVLAEFYEKDPQDVDPFADMALALGRVSDGRENFGMYLTGQAQDQGGDDGMNMFGDVGGGAGDAHDALDPPVTVKGMTFAGCEGGINVVCAAKGRDDGDQTGSSVPESTVNFVDCHWEGNTGLAGVWIESGAYQIPRGMLKRLVDDDRGDGGGDKEDNDAIMSIQPVDYENMTMVEGGGEVEVEPTDEPEQDPQGGDVGEITVDEADGMPTAEQLPAEPEQMQTQVEEEPLEPEGGTEEMVAEPAIVDTAETGFTGTIVDEPQQVLDAPTPDFMTTVQDEPELLGTEEEAISTTTMVHAADNLFYTPGGRRRERLIRARHLQGPYFDEQQGDQGDEDQDGQGGGDDQGQDEKQGGDEVQQGGDEDQQQGEQGDLQVQQGEPEVQSQIQQDQDEQGGPEDAEGEQDDAQGQEGHDSQGPEQQDDTQNPQVDDSTGQEEQPAGEEPTTVDGGDEPAEVEQPVEGGEAPVGGDEAPVEDGGENPVEDGGENPVEGDEGAQQTVEGDGDEPMEPQMPERGMIVNFEDCSFVDNYAAAALIVNTKGTAMFSNTEMYKNEAETIIANQLDAYLSLGNMCLEDNGFSGPSPVTSDPQSSVDVGIPFFLNNINQRGWDDEDGGCSKGVWDGSANEGEGKCVAEFGGENTFCTRKEDDLDSEIEDEVDAAPKDDKSSSTGGSSAATIGQRRKTGVILFALSPLLMGWFALY